MGMVQMMIATSTGGNESALAAVDVPSDGAIVGIDWAVRADLDADGEFFDAQLSFGATRSGVNDSRQVISGCSAQNYLLTSGAAVSAVNKFVGPLKVQVFSGERLYLHCNASAGVVAVISAWLYYDFDVSRPGLRRS